MPQYSGAFTIKDGSATPADVTYSPELLSSGETVLVDRREASRDLQPALNVQFERPVAQRPSFKQTIRAIQPLIRTVNGTQVSTRPNRATLTFDVSAASTEQERKHLHAMIVNAANHALLKAGAVNLDPLY